MTTNLDRCYREQLRCAAQLPDAGARLGLADWIAEEVLMRLEERDA